MNNVLIFIGLNTFLEVFGGVEIGGHVANVFLTADIKGNIEVKKNESKV